MRTPLAGLALALAFAATPALAAGGSGAGTLKKVDTGSPTASPAPAPTTTTTQPSTSNGKGNTGSGTNVNAKTPLTKGTLKKLTPTQTTQASAPSTTQTTRHRSTRTSTRISATRHAASRTGSSGGRRSSRRAAAGSHSAPAGTHSAGAPVVAAAPVSPARAKATHAASQHKTKAITTAHKASQPTTGFASINRAADKVIEVIPGVVLLALAGLGALVFLLIVRSLLMERRRSMALRASYGVTVQALATAIEAKDHTTGGHIERVRELGLVVARKLAPRDAKDPQMAFGFLLHDVGKLAIPDAILRAPGRLSEDEWALMRRHPEEGVRILESIPFLDRALDVVRHHHERWDGGGYPDGLAGTEIPLWARIFSVVDAIDAMTAERPYRRRQPYTVALEEIKRNAGSQFDPAVVDALEAIDPIEIERLLEPAQLLDRIDEPVAVDIERLEAILTR